MQRLKHLMPLSWQLIWLGSMNMALIAGVYGVQQFGALKRELIISMSCPVKPVVSKDIWEPDRYQLVVICGYDTGNGRVLKIARITHDGIKEAEMILEVNPKDQEKFRTWSSRLLELISPRRTLPGQGDMADLQRSASFFS